MSSEKMNDKDCYVRPAAFSRLPKQGDSELSFSELSMRKQISKYSRLNRIDLVKKIDELKRIQNIPLKRFCEILSINTDDNFHTENLVLLAFRYGNEFHRSLSVLIMEYHERDLCMKNGSIRGSLFEDLREIIQGKFGYDEFTRISDSLCGWHSGCEQLLKQEHGGCSDNEAREGGSYFEE